MAKRSIGSPSSSHSGTEQKSTISSIESEPKPLKRVRKSWTDAEEAIYLDLVIEHLQDTFPQFWSKIKEGGRLVGRGCTGVKVHLASITNKLKKAG